MVIILDDDIVKTLCYTSGNDLAKHYGRIINFIVMEYTCSVTSYKENLPAKCIRSGYPHFLWIQASLHKHFPNNAECTKFNRSLEDVAKFHGSMDTLQLKKVWSSQDPGLFIGENRNQFTTSGFHVYWEAVDKTVRYYDSIVLKKYKLQKKSAKSSQKKLFSDGDQKDLFWWKNPNLNREYGVTPEFKKLPPPPKTRRF